jgi:hypothetical protein
MKSTARRFAARQPASPRVSVENRKPSLTPAKRFPGEAFPAYRKDTFPVQEAPMARDSFEKLSIDYDRRSNSYRALHLIFRIAPARNLEEGK